MFRFLQIAALSITGFLITDDSLSDLDLPKVSGWQLPDGTIVFNEYDLMNAVINCELIRCAYPAGTTSRCDNGNLYAASGKLYDKYATEPGAVEISYNPATEVLQSSLKMNTDG
ncbi:hypothetical protein N8005_01505 [Litorivicinus sp.]|nr:hypothetical protein [Litorivicinus sp.]